MESAAEKRIAELGLTLPSPAVPAANYIPFTRCGNTVFISGQIPKEADGSLHTGKLGDSFTLEQGQVAARVCALNLIAQMKEACGGDLGRVKQVLKVEGFVNCTPDFVDHPKVINGCSDLMVQIFGDAGRHSRFAVGCSSLPLGSAVETGAVFEVSD